MNLRDNLGSYVVIGVLLILIVLMVTQFASCAKAEMAVTVDVYSATTIQISRKVYRTIDEEFGIVCYHGYYSGGGISCLEMPE